MRSRVDANGALPACYARAAPKGSEAHGAVGMFPVSACPRAARTSVRCRGRRRLGWCELR